MSLTHNGLKIYVMGKSKSIDVELRVLQVAKYIIEGYSKRKFLIQKITESEDWGVNERQIDNYIRLARELIINNYTEKELKLEKDIALNRLEAIYTKNMQIQDYNQARVVTMDRMKLMGLMVEKTENRNINTGIDLTDEEINKEIERLSKKS